MGYEDSRYKKHTWSTEISNGNLRRVWDAKYLNIWEETREYLLSILRPITQISLAETIRDFEERSINNKFIENLKKSVSAALKDILFKLLCFTKGNSGENIYCKQNQIATL